MPDPENQLITKSVATGAAAALMRTEAEDAAKVESEAEPRDTRLDRLSMELHVMVRVERMRVQDLLALERGAVLTTVHDHAQDVPVRCGGALLLWGEFEMVEQRLAVRVTRLA